MTTLLPRTILDFSGDISLFNSGGAGYTHFYNK